MLALRIVHIAVAALAAHIQATQPEPARGVVVPLQVERAVESMTDEEILRGEVGGVVKRIAGDEIVLHIQEALVPRVGDRVELLTVTKGVALLVGEWRISFAEGDVVRAAAVVVRKPAAKGMKAIVHAAIPAGQMSFIGFEEGNRPAPSLEHSVKWVQRHSELVEQARQAFAEGQRQLAARPAGDHDVFESLRTAARLNHVGAAVLLCRLTSSDGPLRDLGESAKWLRRAAELGDAAAQCALGEALEGRTGILPADQATAQAWYRKAAANSSGAAKERLLALPRNPPPE